MHVYGRSLSMALIEALLSQGSGIGTVFWCPAVVFGYLSVLHQMQLSDEGIKYPSRTQTTATGGEPAHAGPQENLLSLWEVSKIIFMI